MALAMEELLAEKLTAGIVITKEGHGLLGSQLITRTRVLEAGHPLPDQRGIAATRELMTLVQGAGADDLVICLISGGGSALMTAPVTGVSLDDLQELTGALLRCGATINEINTLRKHLDAVKGGGLARMALPATIVTLVLSDVVGDPLDVIASGPTVPDPSTFGDCWAILKKYDLVDRVPEAVIGHLENGIYGKIPDTVKPDEPGFGQTRVKIIACNYIAVRAAADKAQQLGFRTLVLSSYLQGEARETGRLMASIARQVAMTGEPLLRPCCIIAGGETTVTVRGDGKGGRNTELALAAVEPLAGLKNVMIISLATDGGDGPTDAAGAVVSGATWQRADKAHLDPTDYLVRNDSYRFFEKIQDLCITGPTRTNVNDLVFVFGFDN